MLAKLGNFPRKPNEMFGSVRNFAGNYDTKALESAIYLCYETDKSSVNKSSMSLNQILPQFDGRLKCYRMNQYCILIKVGNL